MSAKSVRHLRISDQHGRVEEFTAHDGATFLAALQDAMERYHKARATSLPFWFGRRRQALRASPALLQLRVLDPWATEREGLAIWLPVYFADGACPVISPLMARREPADELWTCVESTATQAEEMARFFGYHPDGQNGLQAFLSTCLDR